MNFLKDNKSPEKLEKKHGLQGHSFENEKNKLKKFSDNIPTSVNLPIVATHGRFGVFQRDVTGSELNSLTGELQKCLIATNNLLNDVVKEFGQVYETFEALDKDYIQALIAGNKAAEIASNQAMKAATKAFEAIEESKKNTNDIEGLLKTQRIMIDKLVAFKERIENIPNIDNVSTMWKDIQYFKDEIQTIRGNIDQSEARANGTEKLLHAQELVIARIVKFKNDFEAIPHILDLNIIWEDVQDLINQIMIMKNAIADHDAMAKERFVAQDQYISKKNEELISLINMNKVDLSEALADANNKQSEQNRNIFGQIEIVHNEIKIYETTINERFVEQDLHIFKQNEELVSSINKNRVDISEVLADANKKQSEQNETIISQIEIIHNAIKINEAAINERFVEQDRHASKQNDELVSSINKNRVDLSEALVDANKKQSEQNNNLISQIEIIHNEIKINEATISERFVTQNSQLLQKIKIAYAVAGVFGAITLTHVVLAVLGIV